MHVRENKLMQLLRWSTATIFILNDWYFYRKTVYLGSDVALLNCMLMYMLIRLFSFNLIYYLYQTVVSVPSYVFNICQVVHQSLPFGFLQLCLIIHFYKVADQAVDTIKYLNYLSVYLKWWWWFRVCLWND